MNIFQSPQKRQIYYFISYIFTNVPFIISIFHIHFFIESSFTLYITLYSLVGIYLDVYTLYLYFQYGLYFYTHGFFRIV